MTDSAGRAPFAAAHRGLVRGLRQGRIAAFRGHRKREIRAVIPEKKAINR
ncbi:hypothetical protein ACWGMA_16620 [Streptomyces asiaticus]